MIKKVGSLRSLNTKTLYALITALICASLIGFAIRGCGNLYVEKSYMSPEAVSARKAAIYSDFSNYVNLYSISGRDSTAVARFTENHEYVNIFVYKGMDTNNHAENSGLKSETYNNASLPVIYSNEYGNLYLLRFSDGLYQISISDSSESLKYITVDILAVVFGAVFFVLLMCLYMGRLTRRIIALSREAVIVGNGDLQRNISVSGNDELSQLALEMDNMRRSVIQRMSNENRAWQANSELITAISHDIRTPMTSMIGYLGLLNEGAAEDPERARQYTASAYSKAMELKDLTDELFKYFLVFGSSSLALNMDSYEGEFLLGQLIGEAEFELSEAGFTVRRIEAEGNCIIKADPLYLKRVLDNMVSNVKKYADKERLVMLIAELKPNQVSVCISNYITRSMERVESTRIGLRTCERIMSAMGGSFLMKKDEEHFAVEFSLPTLPIAVDNINKEP